MNDLVLNGFVDRELYQVVVSKQQFYNRYFASWYPIQDRNLLNMKAGWRNDHWNASIWAKNLNDEAYAGLTAETLPLTGMDAYFLTPPRTFGATLRYDF